MGWATMTDSSFDNAYSNATAGRQNLAYTRGGAVLASGVASAIDAYASHHVESINQRTKAYMLDSQARMSNMEAGDHMRQAGLSQVSGEIAVGRRSKLAGLEVGGVRAAGAGRGLLVDSGTAQSVVNDIRREADEDMAIMRQNAWNEVWGHTSAAASSRANAELLKGQARVARINARTQRAIGITAGIGALSQSAMMSQVAFSGTVVQ